MRETMMSHPRLTVRRTTGSEGPHHDPYAFVEIEAVVPGRRVVLHLGLGEWITVNGVDLLMGTEGCWRLFEHFVGFSVRQLERIHRRLRSRCRACGGRSFHHERGYPGEHLAVCDACGEVVGGHFCESEIL